MGNVAIAFITSLMDFAESVELKKQRHLESKRIRTILPRTLAPLYDRDVSSITTLDLSGLKGVDLHILRLLSLPLIGEETRVQKLFLEDNNIGAEGATCIARIISKDRFLQHVSLAHNPVGSVGVMAIASALEQNVSLDRLDLSYCEIDDKGIQKLSISLRTNTALRFLNVEGNHTSSLGMCSLVKCIYDTTSIRKLWESNHTIRAFYGQRAIYSPSFPETNANRLLVRELEHVLATCNRRCAGSCSTTSSVPTASLGNRLSLKSLNNIASCKIIRHCTKDEKILNWDCVESIEVEELSPHVFSWLANHGSVGLMFNVIREMPWLVDRRVDDAR